MTIENPNVAKGTSVNCQTFGGFAAVAGFTTIPIISSGYNSLKTAYPSFKWILSDNSTSVTATINVYGKNS